MRASNRPARKSDLVSNPWILLSRGEICGSFARSKGCANFELPLAFLKERAARMPARSFSYLDEDRYSFRLISTPPRPSETSTPFDAEARYTCTPFWFF